MYHINKDNIVLPCKVGQNTCPYSKGHHSESPIDLYALLLESESKKDGSKAAKLQIGQLGRLMSLNPMSDEIASSDYPVQLIVSSLALAIIKVENADLKVVGKLELEDLDKNSDVYKWVSKNKLNAENKAGSLTWMRRDYFQYMHNINTSKILKSALLVKDEKDAVLQVKGLSDDNLLKSLDFYTMDKDILKKFINMTNNFAFSLRIDLSEAANNKLDQWHLENRDLIKHLEKNQNLHPFLAKTVADEAKKRGL